MVVRGSGISAFMAIVVGLMGQLACGYTLNWTANCLNQYLQFSYDFDGNMTQCGDWTYTYDAANRLKTVSSNGVLIVTNFYDAKSRRVKKVTPEAATTFFYDGWNLVEERIAYTNGTTSTIRYYWGKDLSGTLQGAGGIGGLLYLTIDGVPYVPSYDNIGNITRYLDANGNTVAQYTYDAFGKIIAHSGSFADFFHHRFSTKYCDAEAGLYYYGYRYYSPEWRTWLTRDPLGERSELNVYLFCKNNPLCYVDDAGREVVVIKNTPGKEPIGGWKWENSYAETYWQNADYTEYKITCGEGRIGYRVDIKQKNVMVSVYFRDLGRITNVNAAMIEEQQHINAIKKYDAVLWQYKVFVESICECPEVAERLKREYERIRDTAQSQAKSYNEWLDSSGGPHGH